MKNLMLLNSNTNTFNYNCGGFAIGNLEWLELREFNCGQDVPDMLLDCAAELERRFPALKRIAHPDVVNSNRKVIGFRIAELSQDRDPCEYCDNNNCDNCNGCGQNEDGETASDFHFVLRHKGKWFHKPGSNDIREVDFDVYRDWPHRDEPYNSEIIWFTLRNKRV